MFLKDIHRNIEGVITASQANDEQVYQELDEYVVTKELQAHFKTFFDAYKKGIIGDTSKMGVWIQGFFGSGKSHFLKILSYILENKEINGKNAFDFFTEGDEITRKIKDDITIADMKLAVDTPTNVILFNVESKHQTGIEEKSSLVNVFLKVFNHSLGYSTIPQLADLERNLDKQGKFSHFKAIFEQNYGETWEETRHEIDFLEDIVVDSLVKAECFSESAARNWFIKNESDYKISIEEFADLVEEYLQSKGNNEHIVFLVDEIGQYIGGNRSLTLQLQTIVEELGNKSRGKAWVIVTSQELIDAVTDISGSSAMDFSKIKGRFETTLSLSSANADEVIQKRILKKNINAQQYLEADYPNHENDISMKLQFEDSPELKLYTDAENYADVYPFIPYQFNLLANILTQISEHSIQGTNLSRGERSLLAFFKETAERNADKENGSLISLDQFYPSLEKWLNETKNDAVIKKAADNSRIVSDADDFFNVDVLKVLFMIKYVDQNIKPTLNNITNLMLRHVDEDKLALRKKVDAALKILINENLIRQNLQNYIFQTDEEQEVTRVINKIELTDSDIKKKLATDIFDDKVGRNSFSYLNRHARGKVFENRYNFLYNRYVDDLMHSKNVNAQLEVKIITPLDTELWENSDRLVLASTKNMLLVHLPLDDRFMNDLRKYLRVEKYVTTTFANNTIKNFQTVKAEKSSENQELNEVMRNQLSDFLKNTTFFFNNVQLEVKGSDFKTRLNDALQQMAALVYHKNDLIDSAITEQDINRYLTSNVNELMVPKENQNALEEVERYIKLQSKISLTVTMRSLRDNFVGKEPYGFVNEDLEWIIARLFKEGAIKIIKNGISLSLTDNLKEVSDAIFNRRTPEKIRIEIKKVVGEEKKRLAKELGIELFEVRSLVDETNDDLTKTSFKKKVTKMIEEFNGYKNHNGYYYPESDLITTNVRLLQKIENTTDTNDFFNILVAEEDSLLDWAEDLVDIRNFHKSSQKLIWEKATDYINKVETSTIQDSTDVIDSIISEMKRIMQKKIPYREIPNLSSLNSQFEAAYAEFIESKSLIAAKKVEELKRDVLENMQSRTFEGEVEKSFQERINQKFDYLLEALMTYEKLDEVALAPVQADTFKVNFIAEFNRKENELREKPPVVDPLVDKEEEPPKKVKSIQIRSLITSPTRLKNSTDVDQFIRQLRNTLLEQLGTDNEIDIQI